MTRWIVLGLLLGGCETDEFVIFGESDGCSSSGGDGEVDEDPTEPVIAEALTEMTTRPAESGPVTPLDTTLPATAPAQERR